MIWTYYVLRLTLNLQFVKSLITANIVLNNKKRAKEAKKNQHIVEIKEVQLTPQIGAHDLETKQRAALKFLEDGDKVKVGVRFRGRQMQHIDVGQEVLDKFIAGLLEIAIIEKPAAMDNRWLIAILAPKKK